MKRTKYFIITLLPFVIATILQVVAALFVDIFSLAVSLITGIENIRTSYSAILTHSDFSTLIMIIYSLFSIFVFGIWYYIKYEADYLPLKTHPVNKNLLTGFAGIVVLVPGLQFLSGIVTTITYYVTPQLYEQYEKILENAGIDSHMSVMMFIYSVLLAPLSEELIFRGVTMSSAKRLMPFWCANIMQALLFGAYHMNFVQGCYAFILGLFLGYVCEKGKSIYFSLFLHLLFNLWAAIIAPLLNLTSSVISILIFLATIIVSIPFGFILFKQGTDRQAK